MDEFFNSIATFVGTLIIGAAVIMGVVGFGVGYLVFR